MRIGLINIATGKYTRFLPGLIQSAREHFVRDHETVNVVLTDDPECVGKGYSQELNDVHHFPMEHRPWPGPTLYRYDMICGIKDWLLEHTDYLFYCDVDMRFVSPVGDEILGTLVGTLHPGFYDKGRDEFTYERRGESAACVPYWQGQHYYAGGFNGGKTDSFLKMARTLANRVSRDADRGITAVWHDESHLNRYFVDRPPEIELDPGHCYPETWSVPFTPKLMALAKDHDEMRATP